MCVSEYLNAEALLFKAPRVVFVRSRDARCAEKQHRYACFGSLPMWRWWLVVFLRTKFEAS